MSTPTILIYRENEEIECEIQYSYSRGMKSRRDAYGLAESPDDPESVEDIIAFSEAGEVELTREEECRVEEIVLEHEHEFAA